MRCETSRAHKFQMREVRADEQHAAFRDARRLEMLEAFDRDRNVRDRARRAHPGERELDQHHAAVAQVLLEQTRALFGARAPESRVARLRAAVPRRSLPIRRAASQPTNAADAQQQRDRATRATSQITPRPIQAGQWRGASRAGRNGGARCVIRPHCKTIAGRRGSAQAASAVAILARCPGRRIPCFSVFSIPLSCIC